MLFAGTVPVNNFLFTGTLTVYHFLLTEMFPALTLTLTGKGGHSLPPRDVTGKGGHSRPTSRCQYFLTLISKHDNELLSLRITSFIKKRQSNFVIEQSNLQGRWIMCV